MMNKNLILITVLCIGYLSLASDEVKVDYMKLTKKNLPNMQQLVQGALRATGVYLDSAQMERDIRRSAIYPDMTIRGHYYPEGLSRYGELSYQSNQREDASGNITAEDVNEYKQIGYGPRNEWALTFEWNLTKLIHSHEERSLSARRVQLASMKRRRTVDVARRYAQLMNALPEDNVEDADDGKIAIIYENALILDVWTGGMITRALDRDITIPHSDLLISETEKIITEEKESAYIEKIEESYENQVTDLLDFIKK